MSAFVAKRLSTLACVALLGGLVAAATLHRLDVRSQSAAVSRAPLPQKGDWFTALAASRGPSRDAERTTCDLILTGRSLGVSHPVLPCGAKVLVQYGQVTVLTEVIDNRLSSAGRQFELSEGLARMLSLDGTQSIRWSFAPAPIG